MTKEASPQEGSNPTLPKLGGSPSKKEFAKSLSKSLLNIQQSNDGAVRLTRSSSKEKLTKQPLSGIIVISASKKSDIRFKPTGTKQKMKKLPPFSEVSPNDFLSNYVQKIDQCAILCDMHPNITGTALSEREMKTSYLKELVQYAESNQPIQQQSVSGVVVFPESVWTHVVKMVTANIFRPLIAQSNMPTPPGEADVVEEQPQDLNWGHLQPVYDFFFHFIASPDLDPKLAGKFFTNDFLFSFIHLLDTDDIRERDYLKAILHKIYLRYWSKRQYIRSTISNVFVTVVNEKIVFNGMAELLEIMGCIIHGLTLPIKQEHSDLLKKVLLPLHKVNRLATFKVSLTNCMINFIEKDPSFAPLILSTLFHYWPKTNAQKQVVFLNELEEIVDAMPMDHLIPVSLPVFTQFAQLITSPQYQIAEKSVTVINTNEYVVQLMRNTRNEVVPMIFTALYNNTKNHWHANVITKTYDALKVLMEMDIPLFRHSASLYKFQTDSEAAYKREHARVWSLVEKRVKQRMTDIIRGREKRENEKKPGYVPPRKAEVIVSENEELDDYFYDVLVTKVKTGFTIPSCLTEFVFIDPKEEEIKKKMMDNSLLLSSLVTPTKGEKVEEVEGNGNDNVDLLTGLVKKLESTPALESPEKGGEEEAGNNDASVSTPNEKDDKKDAPLYPSSSISALEKIIKEEDEEQGDSNVNKDSSNNTEASPQKEKKNNITEPVDGGKSSLHKYSKTPIFQTKTHTPVPVQKKNVSPQKDNNKSPIGTKTQKK